MDDIYSRYLDALCWHREGGVQEAVADMQKGVRGVYNRAEYADQRKEMLQWWADFVDSQIEEGRKVIIGRFGNGYQARTGDS